MDHIAIEVTEHEGAILIFTDGGQLIELHVPPRLDSIVSAIFARPPAAITVSGDAASAALCETLEDLGHEVSVHRLSETG